MNVTSESHTYPPVEGPVIQRVALVDCLTRHEPARFQSTSLPGHLLHAVLEGEVRQTASGRVQNLSAGWAVWHFEDEQIRGEILRAPWTFFTVNFEAPTLAPPPEYQRMRKVGFSTLSKFESLYEAWKDTKRSSMLRHIRVEALLLDLLLDVMPAGGTSRCIDAPSRHWWGLEAKLRGKLDQEIDLEILQALSGQSLRSIVKGCELATGTSPMKRVKELRLNYARGLVLHSLLNISEVAYRIGYARVQELSRDYHERFGVTPTEDRAHGSTYRKLEKADTAS